MAVRNNPVIDWNLFEPAFLQAQPQKYTVEVQKDSTNSWIKDVYIWPQDSGPTWGRRLSHIHLVCVDPTPADRCRYIKPRSGQCTLRKKATYQQGDPGRFHLSFPRPRAGMQLSDVLLRAINRNHPIGWWNNNFHEVWDWYVIHNRLLAAESLIHTGGAMDRLRRLRRELCGPSLWSSMRLVGFASKLCGRTC